MIKRYKMSNYQKGARFEREVIRAFWDNGWSAVRSAGSGCVSYPVPDVVGIKSGQIIAVECKTTKNEKVYLKDAIMQLARFRDISGCRAYLAVRFPKTKPRFFDIDSLLHEEHYNISISDPGILFESVIGAQGIL